MPFDPAQASTGVYDTPRVNHESMQNLIGCTVRMAAKVVRLSGDSATVETSDGHEITCILPRDANIQDKYIDMIANVQDGESIKVLTIINMGNDLDMRAVQAVVEQLKNDKAAGVLY